MRLRQPAVASRRAATSGMRPTMKNTALIVRYVDTAKTSHISGERKFGHSERWFAYGKRKYTNHKRPTWMRGKSPAVMTAKIVIASEARKIDVRQRARKRYRIAEMSVPACPIPIQNTKLVM